MECLSAENSVAVSGKGGAVGQGLVYPRIYGKPETTC